MSQMPATFRSPCPRLPPVRRPVDFVAASVEPDVWTATNYCIGRSIDPECRMLSLTIFAVAARAVTKPQANRTLPPISEVQKTPGHSDGPDARGNPKS
jgi:hypothetical protein